ncbi:MAG: hypothetical protein K2P51_01540 [Rhabdochlamydiaceae bacterium]|nr:hypothetical protein [Rhabdochlamydiaceae bacterium]
MNEDQTPNPKPSKSFAAHLEQMAQLLRNEVKSAEEKLKAKEMKRLAKTSSKGSLPNTIEQIAKLLRVQITPIVKIAKSRKWTSKKKTPPSSQEKSSKKRRAG